MKKKSKKIILFIFAGVLILVAGGVVFGKYINQYQVTNEADSYEIADYYMDLVDVTKESRLSQGLTMSNIIPGETREIVFYVRNGYEENGIIHKSDVNLLYIISLVHTNNLPLEYNLYDSEDNLLTINKVETNADTPYNNEGTRQYYEKDFNNLRLNLETEDDSITFDKYTLEITWPENLNNSKYEKEIDMLYIIIDGQQEEPIAQ